MNERDVVPPSIVGNISHIYAPYIPLHTPRLSPLPTTLSPPTEQPTNSRHTFIPKTDTDRHHTSPPPCHHRCSHTTSKMNSRQIHHHCGKLKITKMSGEDLRGQANKERSPSSIQVTELIRLKKGTVVSKSKAPPPP